MAVEATGPTTRDTRSLGSRFPPNGRTVATGRLILCPRSGIGDETAFRYHGEGGIGAFYWSDEGFGYALAARADRGPLLRIAKIVHQQTSPDGAKAKIPPAPGKSS